MSNFEKHQKRKLKQVKTSFSYRNKLPSKVTEIQWIYAINTQDNYPKDTERGGKWLIFVLNEDVDEKWSLVRSGTEEGLVGNESKVSTNKPSQLAFDDKTKVICVYTYDWKDEQDVKRIRQKLYDLGFTNQLFYKTNEDTMKGKYVWKGDTDVYKYHY